MKKLSVVLVVVLSLCLVVSFAFAADSKGTVKSVDAKAGSIVVTIDGKDQTLKADKSIDLGKLKAGDAVEVAVHGDMAMSIKAAAAAPAAPAAAKKPKAAVGC